MGNLIAKQAKRYHGTLWSGHAQGGHDAHDHNQQGHHDEGIGSPQGEFHDPHER